MRQVDAVAKGTAAGIKSAFAGVGSLLVGGAMISGLRSLMNDFDRVGKLAVRFGTSAESIQRVGVAAEVAGTDVEAVANAMTKAGIAASKAVEQGGSMAELFQRAGINAKEFAAANVDQKLLMIAEAYRAAGDDASKTNAIIEIMGSRAGANLIPLISNVEALKAEMAAVAVVTDETVRRIEEANDTMTRAGNTLKVYFAQALSFFSETAERIGAAMAGQGFKTIAQMEEQVMRDNAANRLRQRGELITDEQGQPVQRPAFAPNTEAGREQVRQAEENARRIEAELAVMKEEAKKAEEAAKSARGSLGSFEQSYEALLSKSNARLKERTKLLKESAEAQAQQGFQDTLQIPTANLGRFKEMQAILAEQTAQIRSMPISASEQTQKLLALDQQFREAVLTLQNAAGPAFDRQTQEAAQTEPERQRAAAAATERQGAGTSAAADKAATETTLQKVANFLEQLNTKLPQPVLV